MKNILMLSPTSRERTQLPGLAADLGYNIIFDDFDGDYFDNYLGENPDFNEPELKIVDLIESTIEKYKNANLAGVTSAVGYPGMSAASVIARRLGLPGAPPEAVMLCEHKYYSRCFQRELVPDATPDFHLINAKDPATLDGIIGFPCFLKPVKSCMSKNAYIVRSEEELRQRVSTALLPEQFIAPFNDMVSAYTDFPLSASYLLQEQLLKGSQVSLEGFVFDGKVVVMGVLDAVMFPQSLSFRRFQYPSQLPPSVLERMVDVATRFFSGIKYDFALFNMELFYDPETDRVSIIEINPKIASQFPNLFFKVDGFSTYQTLLEVAVGKKPDTKFRQGEYGVSGSCVLRIFQDQEVISVPTAEEKELVQKRFPQTRIQIYARPGKRLSDEAQDSASYRYGLIDLGANSVPELEEKFETCKSMLTFGFEPVGVCAKSAV